MRKWCRFVCTTIADPILESYRIMPSHRLWRLWPPTSDLVIPTLRPELSYRRGTARCVMSVEILPIATQQWRKKLLVRQVLNKATLWSWRVTVGQCVINMCTQPLRDRVASIIRCHKQTDYGRSNHLYTDDLLWRNFLSSQCRNCSRDPDHAHLGNTHSSQD